MARLLVNQRLTPEDWAQETRHYEWDIAGFPCSTTRGQEEEGVAFQAGDVALIYPENPSSTVQPFLELMGLHEDDVIRIALNEEAAVGSIHHGIFYSYISLSQSAINITHYHHNPGLSRSTNHGPTGDMYCRSTFPQVGR